MIQIDLTRSDINITPSWTYHTDDPSRNTRELGVNYSFVESNPLSEGFNIVSKNQIRDFQPMNTSRHFKVTTTTMTTTTCLTSIRETTDEEENEMKILGIEMSQLSEELLRNVITVDGSGETTEPPTTKITTRPTTTNLPRDTYPVLSNLTNFILTINCTDANQTLNEIRRKFNETFKHSYTSNFGDITCNQGVASVDVLLNYTTNNDISVLNDLYKALENVSKDLGLKFTSTNRCGDGQNITVQNVDSCYLINACHYCGRNPLRGVCLPSKGVSECDCFNKLNGTPVRYEGTFCWPQDSESTTLSTSQLSKWSPVVVGVLSALAGLLGIIICALLAVTFCGRLHPNKTDDLRIRRIWHLPRAQLPTNVAAENPSSTPPTSVDGSTTPTSTMTRTFFEELDRQLNGNKPNGSPLSGEETLSEISDYDPIHNLDSIIDREDLSNIFHDALDHPHTDQTLLEAVNPNIDAQQLRNRSPLSAQTSFFI